MSSSYRNGFFNIILSFLYVPLFRHRHLTCFRLFCNIFRVSTYTSYEVIMMYPRLRALREDHDLRQRELAEYLNISQTGYAKYETGENDISTANLITLARLYDTSIDYILGLTDEIKPFPPAKKTEPEEYFHRKRTRRRKSGAVCTRKHE